MISPRPLGADIFRKPHRDFGILPFWFLNGELDPSEMKYQLEELHDKGMHGVVFHGRYGLEMPYLGDRYLDRVRFGIEEANRLGLASWIYDEMNWPSGTADKRVLRDRPELTQRYLECISFNITGPWFMCLTGEDSRYLDFERSTPVAVFAIGSDGAILDLTSNLSFARVVPWEVPAGEWRLCYIVEKRADYYIDAMDPESTETFLRLGYEPYLGTMTGDARSDDQSVVGFYSDEPAMHYFLAALDTPIIPWTKNMFRRFHDRNGYDLRSRVLDLFFDLHPEAAQTRHDFYNTTTALYSQAYYRQIHDWCRRHDFLFTAHLLFEEWLRQMVRVEGNAFRHYEHMDVVAVDHLYPVIGSREAPDQHVAIKLASSAAHHYGSERLICESFGGIFMDATMQRMKWITDWEYVLGVNVLNPHGFHYTFEGPRKRDWPPSMFYQYPWWPYYGYFSEYVSRLSETLTGGRHVAKIALVWPINSIFATYLPQERTKDNTEVEAGLNVVTDVLLRLHHDFDYIDEDVLAGASVEQGKLCVGNEDYELLILPPLTHVRVSTLDAVELFVAGGGRALSLLRAPHTAFHSGETDGDDLGDGRRGAGDLEGRGQPRPVDVSRRVAELFGEPEGTGFNVVRRDHGPGASASVFGDPTVTMEPPGSGRDEFAAALDDAIRSLIDPDVEVSNPDVFVLHRRREGSDVYFIVNTTFEAQNAIITLPGQCDLAEWDPTTGSVRGLPVRPSGDRTSCEIMLPAVGSTFLVTGKVAPMAPVDETKHQVLQEIELAGPWNFAVEDDNALVIKAWRARCEDEGGADFQDYARPEYCDDSWLTVVAGAWAYQLSVEPDRSWPIPVWYRIEFDVETVPERLVWLVDGFDGDEPEVWMNGVAIVMAGARSQIDAQMIELDLSSAVRSGRNLLALRLLLRDATGGLVDHIKLRGSFALDGDNGAGYRMVAISDGIKPGPWTDQGFPFFSGRGTYCTTFELPSSSVGGHALLEVSMFDDVVEAVVNGQEAGVRMWDPYTLEVGRFLRAGRNELLLHVANTPANLLNGVLRPSGIAGPPRLLIEEPVHDIASA